MVPPLLARDDSIRRQGLQTTYVFYHRGMETIVLRPAFNGDVDEFGMLIPFPAPPAIRKTPEDLFDQIAAAVDPPEVVLDLRKPRFFGGFGGGGFGGGMGGGGGFFGGGLSIDTVRVVRQEAVGMYEVAVLQAGSAAALKRWVDDHAYRFPQGMEPVCQEYVTAGWCFVAVKTKVAVKEKSDPQPGQREIKNDMPKDARFQGAVQAMGFRFPSEKLVVPMRLSVFNSTDLRNQVFLLTDKPMRIENMPEAFVMRQISGAKLVENLTGPLPVRVIGGKPTRRDLARRVGSRDPRPHSRQAADLFASDVASAITGNLLSPREEDEKQLLNISESLGMRGDAIDRAIRRTEPSIHESAVREALNAIRSMTLTVIDGDFPREVLRDQNVTFVPYQLPDELNTAARYDAKVAGPAPLKEGVIYLGALPDDTAIESIASTRAKSMREAGSSAAESAENAPTVAPPAPRMPLLLLAFAAIVLAGAGYYRWRKP
ncbi:DUF2330 domain-containing protein [Lignipirellula cremea]|uniref:DUF2330 domain-containing protein n=1 Tax=Lignipirellula cremea TaxID=2528010 RepID=A0A518E1T9_9BACT|nr:DUF2330 domain-containing protein [Lignipirellula cremea]QDU98056.1 hypothetical protein Pla8534_59170 [Lignipirellula cremea]